MSPEPWSSWSLDDVRPPWGERPSIHAHLAAGLPPDGGPLPPGARELPDEERVSGRGVGFSAGALDALLGTHGGEHDAGETAAAALDALRALEEEATDQRTGALYHLLTEHRALTFVDPLLYALSEEEDGHDLGRLRAVGRWLATGAADREPVKIGLALLGAVGDDEDRDVLMTLGSHDEFTVYSAVGLLNLGGGRDAPDGRLAIERQLWELGRRTTGWGRIRVIERLADTADEHIRAWLLREGYRNDVMLEYTALTCATAGDLLGALRLPAPDDALLRGAGRIIEALLLGRDGPAEGMGSWPDGAEATELYLDHLRDRPIEHDPAGLVHLLVADTVRRFMENEESREWPGWPERRETLIELTEAVRFRDGWEETTRRALEEEDPETFHEAVQAARILAMDVWDVHMRRLERGEDEWHQGMQTDDPERAARVVALAEERLPLSEISTGPTEDPGLGPGFREHVALDVLLQELRRFPGMGWTLIRTGLRSPVTRNRGMAALALQAWDRDAWPEDAELLLREVRRQEPDEDTAELMERVLSGETQEEA